MSSSEAINMNMNAFIAFVKFNEDYRKPYSRKQIPGKLLTFITSFTTNLSVCTELHIFNCVTNNSFCKYLSYMKIEKKINASEREHVSDRS